MRTRRDFLLTAPLGLLAATDAARADTAPAAIAPAAAPATPGAPPTTNSGAAVGPEVSAATFAEAEKLMQVSMTPEHRALAARTWRTSMATLAERRTGPRALALGTADVPAALWNPALPVSAQGPARDHFVRSNPTARPLPASDEDIAYAPVTQLARWIEQRKITSERLTRIYLVRIARFDPRLHCVITPTADHALAQAHRADREIAAGKYRGPLHGIPYGVKDLLDTAGIPTTYGAEPFRDRIPARDSTVVARLDAAGAVLIAKLSLGALALNDVWFGGQTRNPWLPEEGSSGSSAGPGAATAAALVAFSIGSETGGSIISPSMRCGVTGLRPTFGRVPRTGAMTLCWSLDKLGPMARTVEDTMLVLRAISGPDAGDEFSVPSRLEFVADAPVRGLRLGYVPAWMDQDPATEVDRMTLEMARGLGFAVKPVTLPDWPYQSLDVTLFAEAAAACEELTLGGTMDRLKVQLPDAWPNIFRQARFLSAVDLVQAGRLRRRVALEMARIFTEVDVLLVPSLRNDMLSIGNQTGHPTLTLRTGTVAVTQTRSDWDPNPEFPTVRFSEPRFVPHGVTLMGRLFEEGTVAQAGMALEKAAGVWDKRPPGF